MSAKARRVDRLVEELSAHERVVLIQQSLFEGSEPDPRIRTSAPREQHLQLERLLGIAGRSHLVLTTHVSALQLMVEALELRWQLLLSQLAWALDRSALLMSAQLITAAPRRGRSSETGADGAALVQAREFLAGAADTGPHHPERILPARASASSVALPLEEYSVPDLLVAELAHRVAHELPQRESEALALSSTMDGLAAEFLDEAIVAESNRSSLNAATETLEGLREAAPRYVGEISPPPPHQPLVARLRAQIVASEA